jgi:hypothetical protein
MFSLRTWGRGFLATSLFVIFSPLGQAVRGSSKLRTTELSQHDAVPEHIPAGNPMLGMLIIIGVVAFLVLLAWIFSRIGEGNSRQADSTLN